MTTTWCKMMVGDKMMEIVLITIYLGCLIVVFKDIRTTVIDVFKHFM